MTPDQCVWIQGRPIQVWPTKPEIVQFGNGIFALYNSDLIEFHDALIEQILSQEAMERNGKPWLSRGTGGVKISDLASLASPIFDLLNQRAMALFKKVFGTKATIDYCWANVSRDGEYSLPHAHEQATVSVVYLLDRDKETEDGDPRNGLFYFSDPRIELCCPDRKGFVSRVFCPAQFDCSFSNSPQMVIFPASMTHGVTPYYGTRARISIVWNITKEVVVTP